MKGIKMNNTIKDLNKQLQNLSSDQSEIESKLQTAWDAVFKDVSALNKAITALEASQDYAWDAFGEIVSWLSFDLSNYRECKPYFQAFMREYHCVDVNWQDDTLTYSQGPCIVINEDGDVLDQDSQKWFIKSSEYRDENDDLNEVKRNQLIEAYMEKSGYYPGVFSADRHGNIFHVVTNEK